MNKGTLWLLIHLLMLTTVENSFDIKTVWKIKVRLSSQNLQASEKISAQKKNDKNNEKRLFHLKHVIYM